MNKKSFIILAAVLAVVLILGIWGYRKLSEDYSAAEGSQQPTVSAEEPAEPEQQSIAAPNFTVSDIVGREVELKERFGKPIIVNFWATWCGPCKAELPYFQTVYEEYGDEVDFIMVNVDGAGGNVKKVRKFMDRNHYSFPVYYDTYGDASDTYGAHSIPMSVFINEDGTVSARYVGLIPETTLTAELEKITAE